MLSVLETRFDVIILTEIGARNITTVQNIMNEYNVYYVIPENNFYGGVGIYVHNSIVDVCVMDELKIGKSCHCPRCENESIFLKFTYCKKISLLVVYIATQMEMSNILFMTLKFL